MHNTCLLPLYTTSLLEFKDLAITSCLLNTLPLLKNKQKNPTTPKPNCTNRTCHVSIWPQWLFLCKQNMCLLHQGFLPTPGGVCHSFVAQWKAKRAPNYYLNGREPLLVPPGRISDWSYLKIAWSLLICHHYEDNKTPPWLQDPGSRLTVFSQPSLARPCFLPLE